MGLCILSMGLYGVMNTYNQLSTALHRGLNLSGMGMSIASSTASTAGWGASKAAPEILHGAGITNIYSNKIIQTYR